MVKVQFAMQRTAADAQFLRGGRFVTVAFFKRADNQLFFGFAHGQIGRERSGGNFGWRNSSATGGGQIAQAEADDPATARRSDGAGLRGLLQSRGRLRA